MVNHFYEHDERTAMKYNKLSEFTMIHGKPYDWKQDKLN